MTPEKLDELERQGVGLVRPGDFRDLIAAARREAALRKALYNCGLAAHNGGICMDQKIRGGREKLAYIERTASDALLSEVSR